ncbi:hypothetical protein NDU88_001906 [Pleurodeles waltl]|uniref:Uncharacterized protein n=1 Tax=Pleurodeles waltl TaxID=8319 RepID=A0AAV7RE62_PLEWA|nr:hypothetical protein NDU88_001906 [Pleurodeles waltl]
MGGGTTLSYLVPAEVSRARDELSSGRVLNIRDSKPQGIHMCSLLLLWECSFISDGTPLGLERVTLGGELTLHRAEQHVFVLCTTWKSPVARAPGSEQQSAAIDHTNADDSAPQQGWTSLTLVASVVSAAHYIWQRADMKEVPS